MKKHNVAMTLLFGIFLATMAAGYLLLPNKTFSEMEKRYLAEAPAFSLKSLFSGTWSTAVEDYLTDHVPGRNLFVGIKAYTELLAGRQKLKDVWLAEGKLLESPAALDEGIIAGNMAAIRSFAEAIGQQVDLMVIPSSGWAAGVDGYTSGDAIDAIYAEAGSLVNPVPVETLYAGKPELYYNTDHHWTSKGAYLAYQAYMKAVGREWRREEDFTITTVPAFHGSTYSRSALWLTPGENLELWKGSDQLTVTNGETEEIHKGVFYEERLQEADKYTVFLDGNHSIVRIQNPQKTGRLLVVRDSYSNCLGGFLAESFGEVVLIDLRYYRQPVSELVQQEGFDQVLICYSCSNFLTGANLLLLR